MEQKSIEKRLSRLEKSVDDKDKKIAALTKENKELIKKLFNFSKQLQINTTMYNRIVSRMKQLDAINQEMRSDLQSVKTVVSKITK